VQEYHVTATPISSYSVNSVALPIEWTFSNSTSRTDLLGLQPGTKYNVSIKAKTMDGYGVPAYASFNTEIGGNLVIIFRTLLKFLLILTVFLLSLAPDKPDRPIVLKSANNTATIQVKPILPSHGPISAYRIIVLNEDSASIGVHKDTPLKRWSEAKSENLPYYIAAEMKPEVRN